MAQPASLIERPLLQVVAHRLEQSIEDRKRQSRAGLTLGRRSDVELGEVAQMRTSGIAMHGVRGMQRLVEELAHSTSQIQVRATFALMVAFIALSRWLGTEIILGAFLAGTVISLLTGREGSTLHVKMEAIGYGFFIPVFFIVVGVRFDLPALLASSEALVLVPILLLGAYAVKSLPALVYRAYFSWRETLAAGMLLSARLSLIIAAASIALDLGAITEPSMLPSCCWP